MSGPIRPVSGKVAYAWLAFLVVAVFASCLGLNNTGGVHP